jgi:hypothetical protein
MVKLQNRSGKSYIRKQQRKNHFCNGIARSKEKIQVTINNDGVLGVKLAGLSFASMEKLGYYKVSQQEFGFLESIQ